MAASRHRQNAAAGLILIGVLAACLSGCAAKQPEPAPAPPPPAKKAAADINGSPLAMFALAEMELAGGDLKAALAYLEKASKGDPGSGWLRLEKARVYLRMGDTDKAETEAMAAVRLNPDLSEAWQILGGVYASRQELVSAIKAFEEVLNIDPGQQETRLFLGSLYLEDGRPERARLMLERLLESRPDLAVGHFYMGQALVASRRYREAEVEFRTALRISPGFQAVRFELARMFELRDNDDEAEAVYQEILSSDPESSMAHEQLGRLYLRTGRYQEALQEFAVVKGLSQDDVEVRIKIGLVYYEQKRFEQAAQEFREILEKDPENHRASFYLGASLQEAGKVDEALDVLDQVPPQSDLFVDARLHQAEILLAEDQGDRARELLEDTRREVPGEPDVLVALSAIDEARGDLAMAEDLLRKALVMEPSSAENHFRLGVVLDKRGDRTAALAMMRRAIELDDRHARALNYLGYTLAEMGKNLDEAEGYIRRALALEPSSSFFLDSLGWVFYQRKQYDEAYLYLKRATAANGKGDPVINEHLGDAAFKLGKLPAAVEAYRKALELDHPHPDEVRQKLEKALGLIKAQGKSGAESK